MVSSGTGDCNKWSQWNEGFLDDFSLSGHGLSSAVVCVCDLGFFFFFFLFCFVSLRRNLDISLRMCALAMTSVSRGVRCHDSWTGRRRFGLMHHVLSSFILV